MNQRDIKIPLTCSQLARIGYVFLLVSSALASLSWFTVRDPWLSAYGFVGLILSLAFGLTWWINRWVDEEKTFPFKFSCKCEEEK